jgi:hypothetical protein
MCGTHHRAKERITPTPAAFFAQRHFEVVPENISEHISVYSKLFFFICPLK